MKSVKLCHIEVSRKKKSHHVKFQVKSNFRKELWNCCYLPKAIVPFISLNILQSYNFLHCFPQY